MLNTLLRNCAPRLMAGSLCAFALTSMLGTAEAQITRPAPPQHYAYTDELWNTGFLDCPGYRINWTKTSAPHFDKAIQVETANNQFITYEWTKPYWDTFKKEITMSLEARLLSGPEGGFLRLQVRNPPGGVVGAVNVGEHSSAEIGGRSGSATASEDPGSFGSPDTYVFRLNFSDGGNCAHSHLGDYYFNRVVGEALAPVGPSGGTSVAPVPPAPFKGTWLWTAQCPSGVYSGALSFSDLSPTGSFTGTFSTTGGGGDMSGGQRTGDEIRFVRTISTGPQYWVGRVVGQTITEGVIEQPGHDTCSFDARRR